MINGFRKDRMRTAAVTVVVVLVVMSENEGWRTSDNAEENQGRFSELDERDLAIHSGFALTKHGCADRQVRCR